MADSLLTVLWRFLAFSLGTMIVVRTLLSVVRTFVLPRSAPDQITRAVFLSIRRVFNFVTDRATTYETRDWVMALYAPVGGSTTTPCCWRWPR